MAKNTTPKRGPQRPLEPPDVSQPQPPDPSSTPDEAEPGQRSDFRLSGKACQMGAGAREFLRFAKLSGCDRSRV